MTRFLRGNEVEVVLAKGVDLFKYDSALDSYSENLKRTFDDIYENVFKPQFRKCGEEEDCGSDDGEKSPKRSSKKKPSVCPSKIPRVNKKEDKENQPVSNKTKENKKDGNASPSPKKNGVLKEVTKNQEDPSNRIEKPSKTSPNNKVSELKEEASPISTIVTAIKKEEIPPTAPVTSMKKEEASSITPTAVATVATLKKEEIPGTSIKKEEASPISPNAVATTIKKEVAPQTSPNVASPVTTIQVAIVQPSPRKVVTSTDIPERENQEKPSVITTVLPMKVLAEKKFSELPTNIKLKQLEATVASEVVVPETKPEFKIPLTPSQNKDEKKKTPGAKLRNSMISFMSPKLKNNVLKSPIVRRFSLQKSAMECSKALKKVDSEAEKMEIVTSNAVKTPLKVSFDLKEETKKTWSASKPVVTPRKEKRKSRAIFTDQEAKENDKRPLIIPEIRITPPEEELDLENEGREVQEAEEVTEVTVFEEDAKCVSHYYEFSDALETDDEFFDCEDFDNTVMYDSLCPNKFN